MNEQEQPIMLQKEIPNLTEVDFVNLVKNGTLEKLAKQWKLETSQLRKFFDQIKMIEKKAKSEKVDLDTELVLLIPMLMGAVGRRLIIERTARDIEYMINEVIEEKEEKEKRIAFECMVKILESIVAYRKYLDYKNKKRG